MNTESLTNSLVSGLGYGIAGFFGGMLYTQNIDPLVAALAIIVGVIMSAEFTRKEVQENSRRKT